MFPVSVAENGLAVWFCFWLPAHRGDLAWIFPGKCKSLNRCSLGCVATEMVSLQGLVDRHRNAGIQKADAYQASTQQATGKYFSNIGGDLGIWGGAEQGLKKSTRNLNEFLE